ncbi:hypothetical protein OG698_10025 [Streptomyces sp. NBC_01003]|uniref:hypothetical protein n=1 Tax=Streptomyces sp. NBC_01003 TaxID=2903714 RepID=UPI00386314C4|nr:hypothetical protein OG698_10025 [Streptomyces sp. NBC_01003]
MAGVRSRLATGFRPHSTYEVAEASAALALIATGLGNAVLPDSVCSVPRENVVCQEIEDAFRVPRSAFRRPWRTDDDSLKTPSRRSHKKLDIPDVFRAGKQ